MLKWIIIKLFKIIIYGGSMTKEKSANKKIIEEKKPFHDKHDKPAVEVIFVDLHFYFDPALYKIKMEEKKEKLK